MPLVDCSDGPVPLEDQTMTRLERLYASVESMADELDVALRGVQAPPTVCASLQDALTALQTCAEQIEQALEDQEDAPRG